MEEGASRGSVVTCTNHGALYIIGLELRAHDFQSRVAMISALLPD